MGVIITNAEEIKKAVSMEHLCREMLGINLNSRNRAPCPIHNGKHRNFGVKGNVASCFSTCGRTWDNVALVRDMNQVGYKEALEQIAAYAGIPVTYSNGLVTRFTASNIYQTKHTSPPSNKVFSTIPDRLLIASLKCYKRNNLYLFLSSLFTDSVASQIAQRYKLGTSKQWKGACIFWQVDKNMRIRTGKIMQYDSSTGKRVKKRNTWVHKFTQQKDFELSQCLFGAHLLDSDTASIALVESEKTALIMSVVYPNALWLATGGQHHLSVSMCETLKGHRVKLYPDLDGFESWQEDVKKLNKLGFDMSVSTLLQQRTTPEMISAKYDIADFYLSQRDESGLLLVDGAPAIW